MRHKYEEAGMLFDSEYNRCRDVVTAQRVSDSRTEAVVSIVQLREGLVAGKFTYNCEVPSGLVGDLDFSSTIHTVLTDRHYPSGEESRNGAFSWFPDEILVSHPPQDIKSLRGAIRQARSKVEPSRKGTVSVTMPANRGPRMPVDARAIEFATKNAEQEALSRSFKTSSASLPGSSRNGSIAAASELAELLELDGPPSRIECYDISHTQGEYSVGSRVVFVDGQPAPHLYRKFNIKSVDGVDDYASLEEVLERRFHRAWINGKGGPVDPTDPWAIPDLVVIDGGRGQLSAAIKGMSKARIVPSSITESAQKINDGSKRKASVAVCALAKDQEQLFVHDRKDPVNDHPDSPALLLLRALRDESHRFALNSHRERRSVRKLRKR
jgi:excinuclease UvrABC nuclease subunit